MSHVRTQIKAAAITALTGLTTTGARVFSERAYPTDDLPCLCITTGEEEVETVELGPGATQERTIELLVEGFAAAASGVDTLLDTIQSEVEVALFSADLNWWIDLVASNKTVEVAEQSIGVITINFVAKVVTDRGNPETEI